MLKIMIIDDETLITDIFKDLLEMFELPFIIFNDPHLAIKYYKEQHNEICCLITDFNFYNSINGIQLNLILQDIKPIYSVLMSGDTSIGNKALENKFNGFISKPLNMKKIKKIITDFNDRGKL